MLWQVPPTYVCEPSSSLLLLIFVVHGSNNNNKTQTKEFFSVIMDTIKHSTIVIYNSRVVLTRKLSILQLQSCTDKKMAYLQYNFRVIIYDRKNVYKIGHMMTPFPRFCWKFSSTSLPQIQKQLTIFWISLLVPVLVFLLQLLVPVSVLDLQNLSTIWDQCYKPFCHTNDGNVILFAKI